MPMPQDCPVGLTQALVRIPSENPTGTEAEMAAFVAGWLAGLPGVSVESAEVLPRRPNVVARLGAGGPPLAFVAHMDTVPLGEGWSVDPFGGEIRDGKLFGRGACDMKAGLAAAMVAFAAAARSGAPLRRELIFCATVDEEGTHMRGVNDLVDRGVLGPDALVIATEPSDLKVVVAHKGLAWIEVQVRGKLAHAGNPQFGVDAIRAAAAFITQFGREVETLPHRHPELGRAAVTFSRIEGGIKTNVVPERARLEMDVRLPPPMELADVETLVESCARRVEGLVPGAALSFSRMNNARPPVEADRDGPLARALIGAVAEVTGAGNAVSVFPAYTDASVVQARTGNPNCLVFGPGRLAQAHTVDEYVPVDQIQQASAVLTRLIADLCCPHASP